MQDQENEEPEEEGTSLESDPTAPRDSSTPTQGEVQGDSVSNDLRLARNIKLLIGVATVAAIGIGFEFLACLLFCYMMEVGPFGPGASVGLEYFLTCGAGLLLGFGAAATVVCLLSRSWVVGLASAISIGIGSRLVWLVAWPLAERIVASLNRFPSSTTFYFADDETATQWSILASIPPVVFVACMPLLLARAIRSWRLVTDVDSTKRRSFRMEDIFLTTAVVASMIVLQRVPSQLFDTDFLTVVGASLAIAAVLLSLGLAALIVSPIAFTPKRTNGIGVAFTTFLAVTGVALVLCVAIAIVLGASGAGAGDATLLTAAAGATFGATVCLSGLRLSGLRLASARNMPSQQAVAPPADDSAAPIDVLDDQVEQAVEHSGESEERKSTRRNRFAAAGILAVSCVFGFIASNIESGRTRNRQVWSEFATQNASAGAGIRIRDNALTGLVAARGNSPAQIRGMLEPELETLSLRECVIDDAFLREVALLQNLNKLDLYGTDISGKGLQHLLDAGHRHFAYLGIGKTRVTPEELKQFLIRCRVNVLDLSDLGFSGEAIESLPRPSIHGLVLSGNDINEQWLGEYLGSGANQNLTYLDVTGLPLKGEFLKSSGITQVNALVLDSTYVTDASIKPLARLTQLEALSIRATQITAGGFPALQSLTKLVIGAGPIKENQIGKIAQQTQILVIDRPDFTCENLNVGNSTGYTFAAGPYILDLTSTSLTDEGLKHILRSGLGNFSTLHVANTNISDVGLSYFDAQSVWELDVSNTKVTADGVLAMPQFFGTLRVAPGQFTESELGRIRSNVGDVQIGPNTLIPVLTTEEY